jgi:tetratricopeptide (TPR) repeat protein/DNA-binding SARP family transcriptional activator
MRAGDMEFLLLGPVELRVAGRSVPLGGPRQRGVIASLAAEVGATVAVEVLIDRIWGETPPPRARHALHVYIARFRRLLRGEGVAGRATVVRRSGGYALQVDPECVDAHRFRRLVDRARDPGSPDAERVAWLGQALDLWRGPPFGDLPGEWPARVREGWAQQRLEATLTWARMCLRMGEPGKALARLTDLAAEHPTVESLVEVLMRALYAAGRPAEALDHYERVRRLLAEELGTDPGHELRRLHRLILTADPALEPPTAALPPPPVPRHLPAPPQQFTGRARELATLEGAPDGSTVVIGAIDGMAGVGKTALALQVAHRLAGRYPDGQLFVDLHGYTAGMAPVAPGDALERLLRALGVAGEQIPADLDGRSALYRSRLAGKRFLIMLDNAASETQVAPLLPGGQGCLALITSRRRLIGLDHTYDVPLDSLPLADAITLFVRSAGEQLLAGRSHDQVAEVVELCGRLPLAVRIVAARLRAHPVWTVGHLVERLRDQQHRLTELAAGERSVTAALDLSYHQLAQAARRMYRLLGLHPGPDIDSYAAAALGGVTIAEAASLLDELLEASLLQEPRPGRHRFHDLTRAHAASTGRLAPAPDRHAALGRLRDYYRYTASLAIDACYPYERERHPRIAPVDAPTPVLSGQARAAAWLDIELPNLLAVVRDGAETGWHRHTLDLSAIIHRHLRTRGHLTDAENVHTVALTAARVAGVPADEAVALNHLAEVRLLQGRYEQALGDYRRASMVASGATRPAVELDTLLGLGQIHRVRGEYQPAISYFGRVLRLARATGHRAVELETLRGMGEVHRLQGRHKQAIEDLGLSLEIARVLGHRTGELYALNGLAGVHWLEGRYDQAFEHYQQALEIARTIGHRLGTLDPLRGLGNLHQLQGRHEQARRHFEQALETARITGHRAGELNALAGLGDIHRLQRRYDEAADCYQRAVDIAREVDNRNWQFEALQGLGRLRHATGHPESALAHHQRALDLAADLGQPADQARAHDGLARAHRALRQLGPAREHWRCALDILADLGIDHTEDEEATVPAIHAALAEVEREASG